MFKVLGAQPFNYTDAIDALPNSIMAFGSDKGVTLGSGGSSNTAFIDAQGFFHDAGAADIDDNNTWIGWSGGGTTASAYTQPHFAGGNDYMNSGVSDAGTFVLTETSLDMHCWGENPVVTAKLQLNGQDRFSEREGTYFDLVQPYQHHTRAPDTGINVYSFALRPEEHQPSGSCNFSRIDNATLQLVLLKCYC